VDPDGICSGFRARVVVRDEGLAAGAGEDGVECGEHHVDSSVVEGFGYKVGYCGGGVSGGVEVVRFNVVVVIVIVVVVGGGCGGGLLARQMAASCHSSSCSNASSAFILDLLALMANRGLILPWWY